MIPGPASGSRGFTLIELLVVLVIVGALLGVVTPRLHTALLSTQIRSAADDVAQALRYARGVAERSGTSTRLEFDLVTRHYRLVGTHLSRPLPSAADVELTTSVAERAGDQRGGIRFFPDGTSTGGRLTLSDKRQGYDVDVDWLTGRVTTTVRR